MSRGVRKDSFEKYRALAYNRKSPAPKLGLACAKLGISAPLLAELFKVSYKTMYDWLLCRYELPDDIKPKFERMLAVCKSALQSGIVFEGSKESRKAQFVKYLRTAMKG